MAFDWNVFRLLADISHFISKAILIWAIHSNSSAEGVSLLTQSFYLIVFLSRYTFLPWVSGYDQFHIWWNIVLKLFYIGSSAYIIFLMMRAYPRTREQEAAWKIGVVSLIGSLVCAPFAMLVFEGKDLWSFSEVAWIFSIILESICVLPQLLLLRQTTVPTVIDSFYLVTLGSYRGFYLLNWLVRAIRDQYYDPVSVIFGLIQTAFYVDFAWVYWTRQRVKLRGGSVVDSEDLSKGWLVKRLIGRSGGADEDGLDDEERVGLGSGRGENGNVGAVHEIRKSTRKWGAKGISISADVGTEDLEREREYGREERLAEPEEFLDDEPEDLPLFDSADRIETEVGSGGEWRDEGRS